MPEKNTQNSIADSNFLGADQNGKPNLKISQEKAYQILSEGFVFTMEDDLKEALKRQKMKTDLIPDQARPTGKPEKFQPEKPYFDPFKTLSPDKSGVSIEAPATKLAEITPKKVFPVQPIEKPKEPIAASLPTVEEKSLPFKKVDILDREKQAEKERLAEEGIPQIIPEQEVVQKALAEKEKFEAQKKEREAVEAIRQEAKKQEEKEKAAKVPSAGLGQVSQAPPKKPEEFTRPASSLNVPVVPLKLAGKDWIKGIPHDSLPKIKQELSQKVLALLAELKKLALEERPFSEKRARILIKLKEKNQVLDRATEQTEIVKERQKQIEDSEAKAQTPSQKHDLEQQRWQIEEKLKQAEEAQWLQEEEVEKFHLALAKIDLSLKDFQQKQTVFEKQKAQIQKFLAGLEFLKEKEILAEKIKANRKQIQFLESQQKTFLSQQKELDIQISAIKQQEQKIEERARAIEKQVQQTTEFRERRKLEQERWQVAEQRKIQEKKRWELEKNKEALLTKLQAVESRLSQEGEKEKYFLRKIQEIEAQIGEMPHLPALAKFWEVKIAPEIPKPAAPERQVSAQRQEPAKEQKIELLKPQAPLEALPLIRQETPAEQEVVEQIRLQAKAKEQELAMRAVKQQIEQEKRGITAEMRQKQEEEARQKSILAIKKLAEQEQKKAFLGKLKGPLLKEEILRKISKIYPKEEAQRQEFLERISQKTKPVIKQKVKGLEEGVVFHPMIRKTSLFEKIAVRILLVLLMAGIGIGVYVGVVALVKHNRNKPVLPGYQATSTFVATSTEPFEWPIVVPGGATTTGSTSSPQATATSTATISVSATTTSAFTTSTLPKATSTAQAPLEATPLTGQVPASLVSVSKIHILSYQTSGGVFYASFSQIMQSPVKSGSFEQIAVKDEQNSRFLTISQISGIMQVGFPQEIAQEDTTSTLLVFGSWFGNRLGFIIQTENTSTLSASFRAWESQAESQTEPIFSLMGKTGPALSKIFKLLRYKTVLMRCQTFTKQDLGICYAIYKNYFIFTSSFEQMARIVDKLP